MSFFRSSQRTFWLFIFALPILLVAFAHLFLELYLMMKPCEQCIYIRFAMLVIALGAIFAFIYPKSLILRSLSFILCFYGLIIGLNYSLTLDKIHTFLHSNSMFAQVQGCKDKPSFPLNLPLDEFLPSLFSISGTCGLDYPIISDEEALHLSKFQEFFVGTKEENFENGFYSKGWYLVPQFKFINMAKACLIAFALLGLCLSLALIHFIKELKRLYF